MSNRSTVLPIRKRLDCFFRCDQSGALACLWRCIREFALFLWVARAPFGVVVVGYLLLGVAPQAQDLLIPLVDGPWPWLVLFFVLHFLFWAMPSHYAARILISDDKRLYLYGRNNPSPYFDWLERWIPRLLGVATFLALVMSSYRVNGNLPRIKDQGVIDAISRELYYFVGWCVAAGAVFVIYTVYRIKLSNLVLGRWSSRRTLLGRMLNVLDIGKNGSAKHIRPPETNPDETGLLLLIVVFALFVIVLSLKPNLVGEWLPLAFSLSLILGGWLPILTYLSAIGRRLQAPLLIGAFATIAIVTSIVGDNHDVRLIKPGASQDPMPLDQALSLWMDSNKCTAEKAINCPRPIIVAASGGASRAGFFTTSVLGELLDKSYEHQLSATDLRQRLFAISSVSGSSVGAVVTVAALAAGGQDTHVPCRRGRSLYWYGDDVKNWRGCLESLTTGDFLTPTFLGLTFHDVIPFGFGLRQDRATIIEQSWERHFAGAMKESTEYGGKLPCPADLKCPFYSLRPTKDFWLPLLVLNGVSVTTGQRIITTLLAPKYSATSCPSGASPQECPLFAETWFFHDFLHNAATSNEWRAQLQRKVSDAYLADRITSDVRLSTAAHNSARFPIVSPPGNIRNRAHYIVDRIVDGGYLENFGVLAAFELAQAIHAIRSELRPIILVISNDPDDPVGMEVSAEKAGAQSFLTDLTSILAAVANTRNARGSLAVAQLEDLSRSLSIPSCQLSFARIRVWPERIDPNDACEARNFSKKPRAVPLSWWLSTPVQYRLFEEIEGTEACNAEVLKKIWKAIPMKSDCLG
jgi:predicted acylesterase/phospholipase RssA